MVFQEDTKMREFCSSLDQYCAYLRCYSSQQWPRIKSDIATALYNNVLLVPGYSGWFFRCL